MSSNGELTPRQQQAIACLLSSPTIEAASKNAGVARSTLYEWMRIPAFQEELERAKRRQFQAALGQLRSLVPEAIQGLKELARSSNEQVRLRACVEILKATNAYGSQASLPFTIGDWALEVSTDQKGKLDLSDLSDEALDLIEEIGLKIQSNRA